jgi:hypothetical protein
MSRFPHSAPIVIVLGFLFLAVIPIHGQSILSSQEQTLLNTARQTDDRIKIYLHLAESRIQGVREAFRTDNTTRLQEWLRQYQEILQLCSQEIDSRPPVKVHQARHHEIALRRFMKTLEELSPRADSPEKELLRKASELTQEFRNRFLRIIFGKGNIKESHRQATP